VADIAYALRDLFDDRADHVDLTDERFRAFVNGYRSVRTMSEDELQLIPLLLRLHNLVSMGRLYASLGAGPADDEPQWMTDLRQKFHNKLAYYRAGSIPF
jgi:Ser/Thr protein kinase RdoA (MazF antagonist)